MKTVLVLGAGRSSSSLISYLLSNADQHDWQIIVGDISEASALSRISGHLRGKAISFNIENTSSSREVIKQADVVISLMPAFLHPAVAKICLEFGKHLLTASYVSDDMKAMDAEAKRKGLLFLNECGLDPGIDHMSAVQVINEIKKQGGVLSSFESFTGGLIAPETDRENPWRYKFTWNPRNVVLAGQGTAKFLQEGHYKYIPYQHLFKRITPVRIDGYGNYEGYANRDSLKYIDTYGLTGIKTMLRGTLRNEGYCSSWNIFVQLGCCDDTYEMENVSRMTHHDFIDSFLDHDAKTNVEEKLIRRFNLNMNGVELTRLRWSGLFSDERVGLSKGTPAQILEHILNKRWVLAPDDKDLVVMWHRFVFERGAKKFETQASLIAKGDDSINTAMAKTVGLPLAIAAKLLLQNKITRRGVVIPIHEEIYSPILAELKQLGIELTESERELGED
jgi:saccharopine dehydrogenase-like NADP-dependent oxidoreductase